MPAALIAAAALAATANPLIGSWVGDPAAAARAASTMTITREAISYGSGTRQLGVVPIAGFGRAGATMLVRTRLGATYRFRLLAGDRICRVAAGPGTECFSRSRERT